ncbi:Acyl-CoA thioester hydrolase YbgC [Candidatus Bealeia paramacronuclearis]|uniref:Acyl-CoA thioester hydrolase YbgC n=1 Tax=Candidatus Bealeia paramacronuclearis TaxID=1921001 RepID=A0ABZ2C3Q0_9PROT|nr:Acyl-CoA thioester hydrolase YbgC [Candidatus Bealeia paramacronuclearis]
MTNFLSGFQKGHFHILPLRIQMEDTDAGGITYYANYLKFAERGRAAALVYLGYPHKNIIDRWEIMFVVRKCSVDYLVPACLDEDLEIVTTFTPLNRVKVEVHQDVIRQEQCLVRLETTLVCVGKNLRPAKIPDELIEKLKTFSKIE